MAYIPMTKERWLGIVRENESDLRDLVRDWHPVSRIKNHRSTEFVSFDDELIEVPKPNMAITAPNAEMACQVVRRSIIAREGDVDPVDKFNLVLAEGDVDSLNSLLSSAWFGVPESTSCWSIPGFSIACDLMDDLPEPEQPTDESAEKE